jgi:hypothetical protein
MAREDRPVIYVTDPDVVEARLVHPAAHRARMAHRVIRLRELGFDGENLRDLSSVDVADADGEDIQLGEGGGVGRLIVATLDGADNDRPGPTTDAEYTKQLFNMNRAELFGTWKQYADEASQEFDAEGHQAAAESEAADQKAAEEQDQKVQRLGGEWIRDVYVPQGRDTPWAANALYDLGREGFLAGEIDWDTAVIKVDMVDTGAYTIDLATHKFRSSVAAGARIASSAALGSKTVAAGVADAADITYTALTGTSIEVILIYQSSAVGGGADVADTAQRLIAAIDTATGLPFTPSGGDVTVTWDNTTNRIFKL